MKVPVFAPPDLRTQGASADTRKVRLVLHYPVGNPAIKNSPAQQQEAETKKLYRQCSVRDLCLQWALVRGEERGVWGDMTEPQRRARNRRTVARHCVGDVPEQRQPDYALATAESGTKLQEVAS